MNLSYWEQKTWLNKVDYTIVGSGIVGLSTALHLKKKMPKAKIVILEKGLFPQGASTKNAGFACFGSLSEILQDLESHTSDEVVELVNQRHQGLQLLRQTLGDEALEYQQLGGYELFLKKDRRLYDRCLQKMQEVNSLLKPIFKDAVFSNVANTFDFKNVKTVDVQTIFHKMEARTLSAALKFYCEEELKDAHSAQADTKATHDVLLAQLDRYNDLEPNIDFLNKFSTRRKTADFAGFVVFDKSNEMCFGFGKHKGQKVTDILEKEPGYFGWVLNADFPRYTKKVLTEIRLKTMNTKG